MANSTARIQLASYLQGNGLGQRQYIKNPSAMLNTTQGIVLGAGVSAGNVTRNTTTPITSISDFQIAFDSATNEYVEWTLDTIDRADLNGNCQFSGAYKLSLGSGATVKAQVYQGSNLASETTLNATSTVSRFTINVPCGDGSVATTVRFAQTVSTNASTLNVADLYYGRALNIGSVAQASLVGQAYFAATTNCIWSVTSASFADFSTDADCPAITVEQNSGPGTISTTDADLPQITVNNLPPGNYEVVASFHSGYTATGGEIIGYRLSDGTNAGGNVTHVVSAALDETIQETVIMTFAYSSAGSRTFKLQGFSSVNAATIQNSGSNRRLTFTITRFPPSSEIVYNPATAFTGGEVSFAAAANCEWSNNTNTFTTPAADADCNLGVATGQVTAPATKQPGIGVPALPVGEYLFVATGGFYKTSSSNDRCFFRFSDGTRSTSSNQLSSIDAAIIAPMISGRLSVTSVAPATTFYIQAANDGASPVCEIDVRNAPLQIQIIPLSQNLPAPILVGSVTSNSTGAERIERVRFGGATESPTTQCTSTPCTIYSQSGSWLTSVSRASTGRYTLNIASGIFADKPTCTANPIDDTASVDLKSASATSVAIRTNDGSAVARDEALNVICIGPKA